MDRMPKTNHISNNCSKSTLFFPSFYKSFFMNIPNAYTRSFLSSFEFNRELLYAFAEFWRMYLTTIISEYNKSWKDLSELDKTIRSRSHKIFDSKFREKRFVKLLSDTIANYSELATITGVGKMYQLLSNGIAQWNNDFVEPFRDTLYRTPSQKVCELENYSLFRYNRLSISQTDIQKDSAKVATSPAVLVVYAFINRHYILDLLPEVSVVRSLLKQNLDIFATDWGTPSAYDKSLTIGHFVNKYLDKSVDYIRKTTKSDKISLLGYCWGGNLALMYDAFHPEKV